MKNLLTLGLLLALSLPAIGQGSVRRADTLLQVLSINPTNIATADRLMYLTAGRNSATDGEALFVDWDRTNALATNTTSRFETVAGIGRWVVRPTLFNLTNVFQFLAGSNMTVSVTSTSVTYSAISGSTGLDWFGMYQDPWDYSFDAVTNWVLYSGADSYNQLEWRILNNTNLVAYLQPHIIKYEQLPYLNTNSLLGRGYAGGNPYDTVESISIGANLLLSGGVLSAVTSAGTNSWQIEADGLLVIEPDLIDSSTINVTPAGSSISFAVQGSSITTNHLASDVVTLLVTDNAGLGTNLIVNGSLRQPAIITNSASVTWTINGDGHIVATASGGGGSESTTASNLDTQTVTNQGWFKALSGSDLQFRNFAVGPNLTLRSNANSVTLDVVLSTNSGTVVSVDGGSSLSLINFADNTRIAGTLTTTNMSYDLVAGSITSNYLASSSVTQDKLSATGTPTSTNVLFGDWQYKQITTNMIPGLVAALESLRMSLTFTNGVTNSAGVIHGNYVAGANVTLTTNNGQVSIAAAAGGTTYTFTNGVTNVSGVVHGNLAAGANITLSTNAGQVTIASTGGGTITVSTNNLGFLARSAVIVTNTETSGELTHGTFAIPANTLGVDGDEVEIHMSGQWNPYTSGGPNGYICRFVYDDDAAAELIVSTYGTNAFPSTSSTLSPDWVFRIKRVSSTTAFISMVHSVGNQYNESNSTNIVNDTRVRAIALQGSDTFDDDTVTFSVTLTMVDGSRVATMKTFGYIMSKVGSGSGSGGGGDPGIQTANYVYAGPTTGSPATPTFRALVDADVPSTIPRLANVQTFTGASNILTGDLHVGGTLNVATQSVNLLVATQISFGTNIVDIANGGTLATNAAGARANLGTDNGDNITSGTVADARIASTIARDSEVATFANSTLTWASTNTLNLATNAHRTLVLGGDTTFETGTVAGGAQVLVVLYNDQSTNCALVFPGAWQFFNVSMPTLIAPGKRGLLSLSTFGTTSTNVMATYGATP